jgi:hypothetical protein
MRYRHLIVFVLLIVFVPAFFFSFTPKSGSGRQTAAPQKTATGPLTEAVGRELSRIEKLLLTNANALDPIPFRGSNMARVDLTYFALTHSCDHYGQMVVYLRLCGIKP